MNYADNTYHFRQDSSFLYFFGLKHPGLAVVLDCESGEEILYGDNFTIDDIVWMGKQPTIAERASTCGVFKTASSFQLFADHPTAPKTRSGFLSFLELCLQNNTNFRHWILQKPSLPSEIISRLRKSSKSKKL